jgi:hypothetical protein
VARAAAVPRPRPAWPWIALLALALGTAVGFVIYPTFPNYDSYYSLLWGRELLDGVKPSFDAYRAPTQHPLLFPFALAQPPHALLRQRVLCRTLAWLGAVAGWRARHAPFRPLLAAPYTAVHDLAGLPGGHSSLSAVVPRSSNNGAPP